MEVAMAGGHRRDCTTAASQSHILGAGIVMQGYHPSFDVNSPPMEQHKIAEAEASHLYFQRPLMTGCSMPGLQPSAWSTWTAPIPHCPAKNSSSGALLCFIFPSLSPMLPQGDERPCVCQPSANGHHKGYRKLFWGAGYGQRISADTRTWMPSTRRRGYSQSGNFQDALSLRGYQSRISGNNSWTV